VGLHSVRQVLAGVSLVSHKRDMSMHSVSTRVLFARHMHQLRVEAAVAETTVQVKSQIMFWNQLPNPLLEPTGKEPNTRKSHSICVGPYESPRAQFEAPCGAHQSEL
jgi:hypothetical protein